MLGDGRLGLLGGDCLAVDVTYDVGHASGHHSPGAFGQVSCHDTQCLDVVGAAFNHLCV